MKLTNMKQVEDFIAAVEKCKDVVKLVSPYGDVYNLKSKLSQYVGIAALVEEHGEELELFCDSKNDEHYLFDFFKAHPEVMAPLTIE